MSRQDRQVAVYADQKLFSKIEKEAAVRRRRLGPTVVEILREYFDKQKGEANARTRVSETS